MLMMHAAWILAVLLAGASSKAKPTPPPEPEVQPARQVVVDEKTAGKVQHIRTARGFVTTVEFPEDLSEAPKCGDCTDGGGGAPFRMDWNAQGRYLTLRPNNPVERHAGTAEEENATTVVVRMEHATLTLFVERVDLGRADSRVVFVFPNREAESEYLRVERAKLEAAVAGRVEESAARMFLSAFLEPHQCEQKGVRARNDNIVLAISEICYFSREVIIVFTVENRIREPFVIGTVSVNRGVKKYGELSESTLEFQHLTTGAEAVVLADGENPRGRYELTVVESGGQHRSVTRSVE